MTLQESFGQKMREPMVLAAMASLTLSLASCNSPEATSPSAPNQPAQFTELIPNMSGFLQEGSKAVCHNGGHRPCAILLRTEPRLSGAYINADPTQVQVDWPREKYQDYPGDKVAIKCFDATGEMIAPFEGSSRSAVWYKVVIPEEHVINPAVKAELDKPNPSIATLSVEGKLAVLGWASIEWFNQSTPVLTIQPC